VTEEKLGPGEAWGAIEEMITADEVVRVSALSDAQLDAELAERGLDPAKLRAAGEALAESLSGKGKDGAGDEGSEHEDEEKADDEGKAEEEGEDDETPEELPPRASPVARPRGVTWAVAMGVAAVVALPLLRIPVVRRVVFPAPVGSTASPDEASVLRTQALHDCDEKLWLECWKKLDAAKQLDPKGEGTDEVRDARAAIQKGLAPREP
jgi:hypothetical protein